VVATQVVEAGVDISATTLVTQLAPWASLVQRFGRCARYGGEGRVVVVDRSLDAKTALPYAAVELDAALAAVGSLEEVGCASLESFEDGLRKDAPEQLSALYPFDPTHLLSRREFDELFDTESDLTGHDLDISRFIRDSEDSDVSVFWRTLHHKGKAVAVPESDVQPDRRELCSVPIGRAREWLLKSGSDVDRPAAFVWDYVAGTWTRLRKGHLHPGQTIVVDAAAGGYDVESGFTGAPGGRGAGVPTLESPAELSAEAQADLASTRDDVSVYPYKTIATHGQETAAVLRVLGAALGFSGQLLETLVMAGALHDIGKCHPSFQYACSATARDPGVKDRQDIAKAPNSAWRHGIDLFSPPNAPKRRGFRHELVSVLMLFEWLRLSDPMHDALLGPYQDLIAVGLLPTPTPPNEAGVEFPAAKDLDASSFDLVAYLICAHHGKVRGVWSSTPHDQDAVVRSPETPLLRGVCGGDQLPAIAVCVSDTDSDSVPPLQVHLDLASMGLSERYGRSWVDRVSDLSRKWGPTTLAYLETLVRVADVRASRLATSDARLAQGETP
jgi:CRISPR-associated endonuclease/helicase Cas3